MNADAISANIDAIAALASDVLDLGDKQTLQQSEINANRADIDFLLAQQPAADKYIWLNGATAQIQFTGGNAGLLDWTKDWSVGLTLQGLEDVPADLNYKLVLFAAGKSAITLQRGGAPTGSTNWGIYLTSNDDLYDATTRAQANTWYSPTPTSRLLFVYSAADKRLKYYLGQPGGPFYQRANLAIPDTMIAAQTVTNKFYISRPFDGPGGPTFDGSRWGPGGVDNFIASLEALTTADVTEFYESGATIPEMSLYSKLSSYCMLGEKPYPSVVDLKGNLTGGTFVGGVEADYRDHE